MRCRVWIKWRRLSKRGEVRFLIVPKTGESHVDSTGGIRTIPPGFTRGLDFGPIEGRDDELLDEAEAFQVTPIYRPQTQIISNGTTTAVMVCHRITSSYFAYWYLQNGSRPPIKEPPPKLDSAIEDLLPSRVSPSSLL